MILFRHQALAASRTHPTPQYGPSLLLAVGITVAMLLAAFAGGLRAPSAWWERGARPDEERITYVAPPVPVVPVPTAAPAPTVGAPTRTPSTIAPPVPGAAPITGRATAPRIGPVTIPGAAAPDTGVGGRRRPGATAGAAGSGTGAATAGPTYGPVRVGADRPAPPPLTRAEKDSVLQKAMREMFSPKAVAEAVAAAANAKAQREEAARGELARAGAVSGNYGGLRAGATITFFGGKSEKERARDAAVDADTRARLASVADRARRERADSARRDSLRVLRDAVRP